MSPMKSILVAFGDFRDETYFGVGTHTIAINGRLSNIYLGHLSLSLLKQFLKDIPKVQLTTRRKAYLVLFGYTQVMSLLRYWLE